MFRRAIRTNRSEDWGKYHRLDRKVKRTARANKRASFRKFIQELDTKSPVDFAKKMKALVRNKKGRKSGNFREGRPLDPSEMTGFLHNEYQTTRTTIIVAEQFMITKHMRRELKKALIRAPTKNATGSDGVSLKHSESKRNCPPILS